jgi:hypothetical protein
MGINTSIVRRQADSDIRRLEQPGYQVTLQSDAVA